MYIMGTPGRKRALRQEELAQRQPTQAQASGAAPDAGGHAAGDAVAPVRKET